MKQLKEKIKEESLDIKPLRILSEVIYHDISLKYGEIFEAGTGAEVIRDLFTKVDLQITVEELVKEAEEAGVGAALAMFSPYITSKINGFVAL